MTDCPSCGHCRVETVADRRHCLHCGAVSPGPAVAIMLSPEVMPAGLRWIGALLRIVARIVPGCTMTGNWPGTMEFYAPTGDTVSAPTQD